MMKRAKEKVVRAESAQIERVKRKNRKCVRVRDETQDVEGEANKDKLARRQRERRLKKRLKMT